MSSGSGFKPPKGIGFQPWRAEVGADPPPRSVPVTVITLSRDEGANIARCIQASAWADQHIVVDSGSTDGTVEIATRAGASVVSHSWAGFGAQRQFALGLDEIRNEWIYFVDADEWTSAALAREIRDRIDVEPFDAFTHRLRLVFGGVWMKHGGWYQGSWVVRLARRSVVRFSADEGFAERMIIEGGRVGRLRNDIVDHDQKGIATWVLKHARYAGLAADLRSARASASRPAGMARGRWILTHFIVPSTPLRPLARFLYMFVVRGGLLHGRIGFRFAALHACVDYQSSVISKFRDEGLT